MISNPLNGGLPWHPLHRYGPVNLVEVNQSNPSHLICSLSLPCPFPPPPPLFFLFSITHPPTNLPGLQSLPCGELSQTYGDDVRGGGREVPGPAETVTFPHHTGPHGGGHLNSTLRYIGIHDTQRRVAWRREGRVRGSGRLLTLAFVCLLCCVVSSSGQGSGGTQRSYHH